MLGVCERRVSKWMCLWLDQTQQVLLVNQKKNGKEPWAILPLYKIKTFQNCHAGGFLWLKKNGWKPICNKSIQPKIHFQKQKDPTLEAPKWSLDVVVAAGKQANRYNNQQNTVHSLLGRWKAVARMKNIPCNSSGKKKPIIWDIFYHFVRNHTFRWLLLSAQSWRHWSYQFIGKIRQ